MKANELRQGNLLLFRGMLFEVEDITSEYVTHPSELGRYFYDELQPISLTEEWLLKFGFDHYTNKSEYFNEQVFMKNAEDNGNIKTITVKILSSGYQIVTKYEVLLTNEYRWGEQLVGRVYWKDDLYVHSLQNLYFALTGEELTFKSE